MFRWHTFMYTVYTYIHTHIITCRNRYLCPYVHTYIIHTHIPSYIHTYTYIHIHIVVHT